MKKLEQEEESIYQQRVEKKKNMTFYLIMVFSLLLGTVPYAINNFLAAVIIELLLVSGQILVVKTILNDFYK